MKPWQTETDALGFLLKVQLVIGEFTFKGQHKTYEIDGLVTTEQIHQIKINKNLLASELNAVISHEVYHLFYSIRHLITVDEETEAEVFGGLVQHIHNKFKDNNV